MGASLIRTSTLRALLTALVVTLGALSVVPASAQRGPASRLGDPRPGATARTAPDVGRAPPARAGQRPDGALDAERVPLPPGYRPDAGRAAPSVEDDAVDGDAPSAIEVQNRIRALDATWGTLGLAGGANIGGAILALVGGGIQIGLGVLLLELGSPSASDFAPYFFVLGGTSVLRTILVEFILRPDPRGTAIQYQNMPDATRSQALARMRYGERELEGLAERSLIMRVVDGGLNIASGLAVIPAYLVPRDFELNAFEWLVLIGPAFAVVSGIITLATPSAAERRWQAYDELRRRQAPRGGRAGLELDPLTMPAPEGPSFDASLSLDPNGGGMAFLSGTF